MICEGLWRMEQDLDLFKRQIGGTFHWSVYSRGTLFELLATHFGLSSARPREARASRFKRGYSALGAALAGGRFSPRRYQAADSILFPAWQKRIVNGRTLDPLSERVLEEPEFGQFAIFDRMSDRGLYSTAPGRMVFNWDRMRLAARAMAFRSYRSLIAAASADCALLTQRAQSEFGVQVSLSPKALAFRCAAIEAGRSLSRRTFARYGARRLFVVSRFAAPDAIAAAEDLGMQTIELQHGAFSRYLMGYHYPGRPRVPYATDRLLTFGPAWGEDIELPLQTRVVVIGSANISPASGQAVARIPRQVVILSQWTIGRKLIEIAANLAAAAPQWKFIFRPHPFDDVGQYKSYLERQNVALANLSISDPRQELYELLASAEVQIGVYSTSLYEGMVLGLRTIVLHLPGSENAAQAVERGDAALGQSIDEILRLLSTAPLARDSTRYYARPVASVAAALAAEA